MVVLGLILLLVAVVAAVVLVTQNADARIDVHAFGGTWHVSAFWMAVVGAVILLVGVLGLALMRSGSKRGVRNRRERKQLAQENARLHDRVENPDTATRQDVANETPRT